MIGFRKNTAGVLLCLLVSLLLFSGCGRYRDIRVDSCRLERISPAGLKSVDAGLAVTVYNPVNEITVSGIAGTVYMDGKELGTFQAPEVTVPGRETSEVDVEIRASLSPSMNFMQIMSLASGFELDRLSMDVSMKIRIRGGVKKKIDIKGVPVADFFSKVRYESI